tara:strand:+ start:6146 stop:6496 length:351 start_codon:yes stop_codon:yes gene_type:complete
MNNRFNNLTTEQSNLIILKTLCILEERKYSQFVNWPFEDISINDIFNQINKIYSDSSIKDKFIRFCLTHIEKKKQYSVIEGILNLILLFEELERYEDCIILKNIKDSILLDLQRVI